MDYETVSAQDFGASLRGLGLNVLVRDVRRTAAFLQTVFGMQAHRLSADFAIMTYAGDGGHPKNRDGDREEDHSGDRHRGAGPYDKHYQIFQLHADPTYASNPLLGLMPEAAPRGAGLEIRLYDSDPELAVAALKALPDDQKEALTLLQEPSNKPHGLREAYILDYDGYAWVPSRPITQA